MILDRPDQPGRRGCTAQLKRDDAAHKSRQGGKGAPAGIGGGPIRRAGAGQANRRLPNKEQSQYPREASLVGAHPIYWTTPKAQERIKNAAHVRDRAIDRGTGTRFERRRGIALGFRAGEAFSPSREASRPRRSSLPARKRRAPPQRPPLSASPSSSTPTGYSEIAIISSICAANARVQSGRNRRGGQQGEVDVRWVTASEALSSVLAPPGHEMQCLCGAWRDA